MTRVTVPRQCPKLRVHPAPGVHISTAGCTILGGVHPVCARFLNHVLLLYIGRVHAAISGCTLVDLCEVHPASAKNKSLISDTARVFITWIWLIVSQPEAIVQTKRCGRAKVKAYILSIECLWQAQGHYFQGLVMVDPGTGRQGLQSFTGILLE